MSVLERFRLLSVNDMHLGSRRAGFLALSCLAGVAAGFAGAAEPEAVVALVVDTSGSVGEAGRTRAATLAQGILAALGDGGRVAVFTFDDQARLLLEATGDGEEVRRALGRAETSGRHTALNDALYDAGRYLSGTRAATTAIVLVTDGRDAGSALDLDDGLRLAEQTRIRVFTVGVGRTNERVLRRLAKLTGGDYVPAASADGATLAARIRAGLPAAMAAGPTVPPASADPAPVATAASRSAAGEAPRPRPSTVRWVLAALVVAMALAVAWAIGRRADARPPRSDASPTLLSRIDAGTEPLDHTVALSAHAVLRITRGAGTGRAFELSRASALSLGRARAHDVVLEDVSVSSQHCRIRPEDGGFVVHDLKSTNGTFVNDRRVTEHPLAEGDVIQIGETRLVYNLEHRRA
jgi:hypothetical protein